MDIAHIQALFNEHQRRNVSFPDITAEHEPPVIRHIRDDGMCWIMYSEVDEHNADAIIEREKAYFNQRGQTFEWKYYSFDRPADLLERLRAHGFVIGEDEAVMVLDMHHAPARLLEPPHNEIRRIEHAQDLHLAHTVVKEIWGGADATATESEDEAKKLLEEQQVYVGLVDGKPASFARLTLHPGTPFASMWGGATREQYRGRGIYTDLVAVRVQEALRHGHRYLTLDASPMSRPIVEKLGFVKIATSNPCVWEVTTVHADSGEGQG